MSQPPNSPTPPAPDPKVHSRKKWMVPFLSSCAGLALITIVWWVVWGRFYEFTDDAYVTGNSVMVTAQIPGSVTSILADETQLVAQGQLLIQLDRTEYLTALEWRKAELAEKLREAIGLFQNVAIAQSEVLWNNAAFMRAALDYDHRHAIVGTGAVAEEEYEHKTLDLSATFARLEESEHKLASAMAMVNATEVTTHPIVQAAKEQLKDAYLNLWRCDLRAPVRGLIGPRRVQVGERIEAGLPLLSVIPLDQVWVYANFKETQLTKMRIGQSVKVTADIYDDALYHGTVVGIAGGSGAVFSIIPPQNATGNWIKIVQRIPVRIALRLDELEKLPLRLGLSTEVTVDLHDTTGAYLPDVKTAEAVYSTPIFDQELEGVGALIDAVILDNVPPLFLTPDYYTHLFMMEEMKEPLPHEPS